MHAIIALVAVGIGGFALYGVLHQVHDYANAKRGAAFAVLAFIAAAAMLALHAAFHIGPHVLNEMARSTYENR